MELLTSKERGVFIRSLRAFSLLSQKGFAVRLNISPSYLSELERGLKPVSLDLCSQVCTATDTDFGTFTTSVIGGLSPERIALKLIAEREGLL